MNCNEKINFVWTGNGKLFTAVTHTKLTKIKQKFRSFIHERIKKKLNFERSVLPRFELPILSLGDKHANHYTPAVMFSVVITLYCIMSATIIQWYKVFVVYITIQYVGPTDEYSCFMAKIYVNLGGISGWVVYIQ